MHQKFDFGMEPKITTLLPTYASRSLLSIWFVAVAFLSEDGFLKKGTPRDLFCPPPWIRPWADLAETPYCLCGAMSTSSLPSFVNINQVVL